jgi:hypothetical protein
MILKVKEQINVELLAFLFGASSESLRSCRSEMSGRGAKNTQEFDKEWRIR